MPKDSRFSSENTPTAAEPVRRRRSRAWRLSRLCSVNRSQCSGNQPEELSSSRHKAQTPSPSRAGREGERWKKVE
ncbi:hypothetical protein D4764_10G0005040 [Takifugu flavidus]|uniref:Uncharacterized protein n=1 Tax=Takifugu flavidus TaxID=433684 RepID=A0A5C6PI58_9TELE|nr:hypothetical protein D4764_10G0005040 [Takifugu flavidus]